eukprot:11627153-Karenia_brevis.AAC.1
MTSPRRGMLVRSANPSSLGANQLPNCTTASALSLQLLANYCATPVRYPARGSHTSRGEKCKIQCNFAGLMTDSCLSSNHGLRAAEACGEGLSPNTVCS